jgi:hypothetical protein
MASAVRELRALLAGLRQLERQALLPPPALARQHLVWLSDAQAAVKAVRKGASRIPHMEAALRALALWEARTGIRVWAFWTPREELVYADELSRYWLSPQHDDGSPASRAVVTRIDTLPSLAWHESEFPSGLPTWAERDGGLGAVASLAANSR